MIGKSFTYSTRTGVTSSRKILREKTVEGTRMYFLRNLDNPESKEIPAVADMVDRLFKTGAAKILPKDFRFKSRKANKRVSR